MKATQTLSHLHSVLWLYGNEQVVAQSFWGSGLSHTLLY